MTYGIEYKNLSLKRGKNLIRYWYTSATSAEAALVKWRLAFSTKTVEAVSVKAYDYVTMPE
jgi:hypothetical protein